MKYSISFFSILLLICCFQQASFAQAADAPQEEYRIWPDATPNTLAPGRKVVPLFGVKKMGTANNMEWQIQPIFFFVAPNLGLKKKWGKTSKGLIFSTFHRINYPSLYLNLIAREGSGGVLPKSSEIPPMLSIRNEFLLGLNSQGNFITLRAGIATAFQLGKGEKNFPDIDYPFLYNRTLALNNSPNIYVGLNFNRDLLPKLNLEADITAFRVGNETNDFVYESRLLFFWKKSDKFGLKVGAAAAHGRYPYGSVFQLLPVFDVIFGFGNSKRQ